MSAVVKQMIPTPGLEAYHTGVTVSIHLLAVHAGPRLIPYQTQFEDDFALVKR